MGVEDAVPLPVTDQLVRQSSRASAESPAPPERQLVAEVGVELVLQTVGCDSAVQLWVKPVQERRRLIIGGRGEEGGIDIHYFPPRVIGFEIQSASGTLDE